MEETNVKNTIDLPDSAGDNTTDKAIDSDASKASARIFSPKIKPPMANKKDDTGKGSPNPTNNKAKPASTSDEEAPVDWDLLNQPEVSDDDEDPEFIAGCSQNGGLRYFHKRSPEWWAEYNRAVKIAEDAPLPEDADM